MIKLLVFYIFLCFPSCINSNKQKAASSNENSSIHFEVDTSRITVIPYEKIAISQIFKDVISTKLALDDYKKIDNLLEKCVNDHNKHTSENDFKINNLSSYKRQYIAVINSSGETEVWINCFCDYYDSDFLDWKKYIVFIRDGGNCFFNVKVNLTTTQYYDLRVNGYA